MAAGLSIPCDLSIVNNQWFVMQTKKGSKGAIHIQQLCLKSSHKFCSFAHTPALHWVTLLSDIIPIQNYELILIGYKVIL